MNVIERAAAAFEELALNNMSGFTAWIGSLTARQAAWFGIAVTLAVWIGWNAFARWWNHREDEAYDSTWMDWQAWRETR